MPATNRINLLSMVCSCVAHAAILGGCLLAGYRMPHGATVPVPHDTVMAVSFAPVPRAAAPQESLPPTRSAAAAAAIAPTGAPRSETGSATPDATVAPVGAADAASMPDTAPVAPRVPDGAAAQDTLATYQRQLYETIARNSRYPAAARRLHLSGVTQLAFRLDRAGNVLTSWIQESSGSDVLDTAATDALTRAQPLPPIPVALPARMDFVIELDSAAIQQVASGSAR